jgi:hypothetical protein
MNWTGYLKQARANEKKKLAAAARKAEREKNYMVERDHMVPITLDQHGPAGPEATCCRSVSTTRPARPARAGRA